MVNTTDRPIHVDGVRLDTLAWNVLKINRQAAGRRASDLTIPGRDGALASINDALEPTSFGLDMLVMGSDADGLVPAAGKRDTMRANLDELLHLFGTRHRLIEVREQTGPGTFLTNLMGNPSVATNVNWSNGGGATLSVDGTVGFVGATSLKAVNATDATMRVFTDHPTLVAGRTYVSAVWMKPNAVVTVKTEWGGDSFAEGTPGTVTLQPNVWTRVVSVRTLAAWATTRVQWVITGPNATPGALTVNLDCLLVCELPSASFPVPAYFDGDTANDAAYVTRWTGTPHASPSERIPASTRRAWAKVVDTIAPDVSTNGGTAQFTVGLSIPAGMWEDMVPNDWTSGALTSGASQEVTTLQGATERITDSVVLLQGPSSAGVTVTDPNTGASATLAQALTATQQWRLNMATWSTRWGTGLTLGSADTAGTDAQTVTTYGGMRSQPAFLPLVPVREAGARRVRIAVTGGGLTGTSRVSVRASRKFAA